MTITTLTDTPPAFTQKAADDDWLLPHVEDVRAWLLDHPDAWRRSTARQVAVTGTAVLNPSGPGKPRGVLTVGHEYEAGGIRWVLQWLYGDRTLTVCSTVVRRLPCTQDDARYIVGAIGTAVLLAH